MHPAACAGCPPTVTFHLLFGSPAYCWSAASKRGCASRNAGCTNTRCLNRGPRWNFWQTEESGVMSGARFPRATTARPSAITHNHARSASSFKASVSKSVTLGTTNNLAVPMSPLCRMVRSPAVSPAGKGGAMMYKVTSRRSASRKVLPNAVAPRFLGRFAPAAAVCAGGPERSAPAAADCAGGKRVLPRRSFGAGAALPLAKSRFFRRTNLVCLRKSLNSAGRARTAGARVSLPGVPENGRRAGAPGRLANQGRGGRTLAGLDRSVRSRQFPACCALPRIFSRFCLAPEPAPARAEPLPGCRAGEIREAQIPVGVFRAHFCLRVWAFEVKDKQSIRGLAGGGVHAEVPSEHPRDVS